jgi:hypothetical protein
MTNTTDPSITRVARELANTYRDAIIRWERDRMNGVYGVPGKTHLLREAWKANLEEQFRAEAEKLFMAEYAKPDFAKLVTDTFLGHARRDPFGREPDMADIQRRAAEVIACYREQIERDVIDQAILAIGDNTIASRHASRFTDDQGVR